MERASPYHIYWINPWAKSSWLFFLLCFWSLPVPHCRKRSQARMPKQLYYLLQVEYCFLFTHRWRLSKNVTRDILVIEWHPVTHHRARNWFYGITNTSLKDNLMCLLLCCQLSSSAEHLELTFQRKQHLIATNDTNPLWPFYFSKAQSCILALRGENNSLS